MKMMQVGSYYDKFFKVSEERIEKKPNKLFESTEVYLIVDIDLKSIWIWAGNKSRLFQRYVAAKWAGKLKSTKDFYGFKYEVIKEGLEPVEFQAIFYEIKQEKADVQYPGQSRKNFVIDVTFYEHGIKSSSNQTILRHQGKKILLTERSRIKNITSELKQMQMHIMYSMENIENRIKEIERIVQI